jgi:transcriptional regulator with XRE-family HTH domain
VHAAGGEGGVRFAVTVGETLREARRRRGLTLQQVGSASNGRFKASAVGGYERGERMISLERFEELSRVYGIPADRLLGEVMDRLEPEGRGRVVLDLNRLPLLDARERELVSRFISGVRAQRGSFLGDVITLRSGDMEVLAMEAEVAPATLVRRLTPAIRRRSR